MATPRTAALGLTVGAIFAAFLTLWLRVVPFLAIAAGASALVLILVLAAAFAEDAEAADTAWRRAVTGSPPGVAGRSPGDSSSYEPAHWDQPVPAAAAAERGERDEAAAAEEGADG
jgi:hypothetical protein